MSAENETNSKFDLRGIDPRKPFYLATMAGNTDGSIDAPDGDYKICETVEDAVEYLLHELDDALLDGYVFHCVPVRYVGRGPLRVRPLGEAPIEQRKVNGKRDKEQR